MPGSARSRLLLPAGYDLLVDPGPDLLERFYRLRVDAWRARTAEFPDIAAWSDRFDAVARHFLVLHAGQPVAAARLTIHEDLSDVPDGEVWRDYSSEALSAPLAVFGRLAVDFAHRGNELSRTLDETRIETARNMGCQSIFGSTTAGPIRVKQLCALGFRVLGSATRQGIGPLIDFSPPICLKLELGPAMDRPLSR